MVTLSFKTISERLRQLQLPEFDLVIGIGNGGIVPASLVAYILNAELRILVLNYRDESNTPRYDDPQVITFPEELHLTGKKVLVVDDVSVSGKTLQKAREILGNYEVVTLTMKGKADIVLFPEIKECVRWPWKI
jgi:hypoxanthine phosphoribosyltransferase